MPLAVSGRWRATTMPATSTVAAVVDPLQVGAARRSPGRGPGAAAPSGACRGRSRSSGSRRSACPSRRAAPAAAARGGSSGSASWVRRAPPRPLAADADPPERLAPLARRRRPGSRPAPPPRPAVPGSPAPAPEREASSAIPAVGPAPLALGDQRLHLLLAHPLHVAEPDPHHQAAAQLGSARGDSTWQRTLAAVGVGRGDARCRGRWASWTSESGG